MYSPKPQDRFTFGLWTVGNRGGDTFGSLVRPRLKLDYIVHKLAQLGVWGVNFHDDDLVPPRSSVAQRDRIVREFKQALDDNGLVVPMATTNLFTDPVFRAGAFTSPDARVRAYALQKAMKGMDLGAELGARIYVFWGGREGADSDSSADTLTRLAWYREALNFLSEYVRDQGYAYSFALEPKPNEPRGDLFLPTVGSMLGFIATLDRHEMFGVNPEFAHAAMTGLNFTHEVAQAIDAGKLFHIDLNDQRMSRFDQDLRFGSENLKVAFFTVRLLEDSGYGGPRHFDAHAFRTEDEDGVWAFAKGCMQTYLILKEKSEQFDKDPEIQELLASYRARGNDPDLSHLTSGYSSGTAQDLETRSFDLDSLRAEGYAIERLDQAVVELILGVRT